MTALDNLKGEREGGEGERELRGEEGEKRDIHY